MVFVTFLPKNFVLFIHSILDSLFRLNVKMTIDLNDLHNYLRRKQNDFQNLYASLIITTVSISHILIIPKQLAHFESGITEINLLGKKKKKQPIILLITAIIDLPGVEFLDISLTVIAGRNVSYSH